MAPLIASPNYDAIRAALDVALDATALPDATIAFPQYLPAAEREVLQRDPLAATRTDTELEHIEAAVYLLTAARLAPAVPQIVSESHTGTSQSRQTVKWDELAATLRRAADLELGAVLAETPPATPSFFGVAAAGRRR